MTKPRCDIQLIMPVHNEETTIASTLREWVAVLPVSHGTAIIVAEDGSTDNTREVLKQLAEELPLQLALAQKRRGYADAVIAAFGAADATWVLAVDGDGQCDPADFARVWEIRHRAEVIIGWRVHRADTLFRRLFSGAFGVLYRRLFPVAIHDPSCPFVLFKQEVFNSMLPDLGVMPEAFWWEFIARAHCAGCRISEVPVSHRHRKNGGTRVFTAARMPSIATRNITALLRLKRTLV